MTIELSDGRARRIYRLLCLVFFGLAIAFVALKQHFSFAVSDGGAYYSYLPSAVIDGDLDFDNQAREHGGPDYSDTAPYEKTPLGLRNNRYPVGFALTVAPAFLAAHVVAVLSSLVSKCAWLTPDGYAPIYQLFVLAEILLLAYAMMLMLHRFMRGRLKLSVGASVGAVISFFALTHAAYYLFREPFMVHAISAFWVCCLLVLATDVVSDQTAKISARTLLALGFVGSIAVICRPTNALFLSLVSVALWRRPLRSAVLVGVGAVPPLIAQLIAWHELSGRWVYYSYQGYGFDNLASPFLLQTLFSSRHGLFFWSPLLIFCVAGLLVRRDVARDHPTIAALLGSAMCLWYFNSSWAIWWFGDAFGARAFLELTPLFVVGLGLFYQWIANRSFAPKASVLFAVALCFVYNYALMGLYIAHRIARADYLF